MILKVKELGLPLPGAYVGFSPWFGLFGDLLSFDAGTDAADPLSTLGRSI
jgi:hypothetical protein